MQNFTHAWSTLCFVSISTIFSQAAMPLWKLSKCTLGWSSNDSLAVTMRLAISAVKLHQKSTEWTAICQVKLNFWLRRWTYGKLPSNALAMTVYRKSINSFNFNNWGHEWDDLCFMSMNLFRRNFMCDCDLRRKRDEILLLLLLVVSKLM